MPRVLVLCIDRDDDLGVKAHVASPVVGRAANVDAATRLALADPEDSDANAIFAAVHAYDALVADGESAEVVTLTGHARVGAKSDLAVAAQLDVLVARLAPERCIFITDGAEDEYLLPLVSQRVKVDAVRRVIVKQHADLESTYYVIKKALEDDKLQRTVLLPIGLALLVYGASILLGLADKGLGAIAAAVGAFFLGKVLRLGESAKRIVRDARAGLATGRLSLFTSMLALLLLVAGVALAAREAYGRRGEPLALLAVDAALAGLWWIVAAGLVGAAGNVLDAYVRSGEILWAYWTFPFSLVATGLILTGALHVFRNVLLSLAVPFTLADALDFLGGFIFAVTGAVTNAYVRERAAHPRESVTR
ncbi:MAG: DUF373 family protein [Thermoplasmatota archaeon]